MALPVLSLLIVLVVALVAGRAAERLGYPPVLGELLAGILVGPPILGLIQSNEALTVIAELGIVLMMLYVGMEIDPAELRKASRGGLLAAIGGFATPFFLAYLLVVQLGGTTVEGLFVGMAAGVTSLLTKSRILVDLHLLDTRVAHVMMAGALVADTLSLVIFAGIIGSVDPSQPGGPLGLLWVAAKVLLFFGAAWAVGRFVFPRIGALVQRMGEEVSFTALLILSLAFAEAAHLAGLHAVLGAFLAGLFLREKTVGRTLTHNTITWVRRAALGFLAPVFFVTAGFEVGLDVIWNRPVLFFSVIAVATIGKIAGTALFYLPTGNGWREGLVIGGGMNGRGAVEIVIAQIGLSMGIIDADTFSVLVLMAILTTALVPFFLKYGTDWLRARGELVRSHEGRVGAVIIGAGPANRELGLLLKQSMPVTLIDTSADNCEAAREAGLEAVQGSALDDLVLSRAGASNVQYLLAHSGNREVDALAARQARSLFAIPTVHIVHDGRNKSAHDEVLGHTQGQTAFGPTVRLEDWDFLVSRGQTALVPFRVDQDETMMEFLASSDHRERILPLAVQRAGAYFPTSSATNLQPGDTLFLLEARTEPMAGDPVRRLIDEATVLDVDASAALADVAHTVAEVMSRRLDTAIEDLEARFADPELWRSTIVAPGVAIPHIRLAEGADIEMILVRARDGVVVADADTSAEANANAQPLKACFVIVTPDGRRGEHLRLLAGIVRVVARDSFMSDWMDASGAEALRRAILLDDEQEETEVEP